MYATPTKHALCLLLRKSPVTNVPRRTTSHKQNARLHHPTVQLSMRTGSTQVPSVEFVDYVPNHSTLHDQVWPRRATSPSRAWRMYVRRCIPAFCVLSCECRRQHYRRMHGRLGTSLKTWYSAMDAVSTRIVLRLAPKKSSQTRGRGV